LQEASAQRLELIQNAQDKLKKEGKIRYSGFVCHSGMTEVTSLVLEKAPKYFDAALLSTALVSTPGNPPSEKPNPRKRQRSRQNSPNRTTPPESAETDSQKRQRFLENLKELKHNGMGILSMKSGARTAVSQGYKIFQPHAKAILNAGADTVLTSITNRDELEMIKKLDFSDLKLSPAEKRASQAFHQKRGSACQMCGNCRKACPQGLPVSDLMRIRMYHDEYHWPEHAQMEFERLGFRPAQWISQCTDCSKCAGVCPVGLACSREVCRVASLFA
jgi:ferredoxin